MIPEIIAPENHSIVVVAQNVWGRGKTLKEAIKQARKVGSIKNDNYNAYITSPDALVNDFGELARHSNCLICKQIIAKGKQV